MIGTSSLRAVLVVLAALGLSCARAGVEQRLTDQGSGTPLAPAASAAIGASAAPSATAPLPRQRLEEACRATTLLAVGEVMADEQHPCRPWVEAVAGRVLAQEPLGSAVLWTRRTDRQTGIIAGALHTLGAASGARTLDHAEVAALLDPSAEPPAPRLHWPTRGAYDGFLSPMFLLLLPRSDEPPRPLADTPPRGDFFLAAVDAQRSDAGRPRFEPLEDGPIPADDPLDATTRSPTWAALAPGARVLLVGVPHDGDLRGREVASTGVALADDEVREALGELARAGDAEAALPYEPTAEAFIEAPATRGMSGGGAFDGEGRLVGVVVRATDRHPTRQLVRVVRMSWIVAELERARAALPAAQRARVEGWLEANKE